MATPTPTIRPIPTTFDSCVAEREPAGRSCRKRGDPASFDLFALWRAYRACRKGKRQTRDTQAYEARLLDNLVSTRDALASASWRPSPLLAFVVAEPKRREIHAAPFGDRVVHHLLVERLARLYEPIFIHDSCANRKGKGTHFAVDRLQGFMRQGREPLFALQLDIANFFNRIHRPTLFRLIQHRLVRAVRRQGLAREEARALQAHCRALLANDPSSGVRRKGSAASFASVPPHKRLSGQEAGRGLPIGNLTSQFFANVYLNELDQFVKHELKVRHYVRYVDDFVLLHADPAQLLAWRDAIETFLAERLGLELKERTEPKPVAAGVDFLGYIVRPHYRLVRRRTVRRFQRVLAAFERRQVRANALSLAPGARDTLRAQIASYRAHLSHAASHRLWQRSVACFPWLAELFADPATAAHDRALRPAWQPAAVSGIASQYRYFAQRHPDARVLIEVGNRWLLPVDATRGSGLARDCCRPASADFCAGAPASTRHYPGLGDCIEYRAIDLPGLRRRWKRQGIAHALVAQDGHFKTGFKRRALRLFWRPATVSPSSPPSTCRGVS
jgi:retron-type reverse transcriptase